MSTDPNKRKKDDHVSTSKALDDEQRVKSPFTRNACCKAFLPQ